MYRCTFACALTLCSACTLDFDVVGPRGGGGSGTAGGEPLGAGNPNGGNGDGAGVIGGEGAGGTPVVDCTTQGGRCVPLPDGFEGAVILSQNGCSAASEVFDGYGSFVAADAICGCSCVPESAQCGLPGQGLSFPSTSCMPSGATGNFSLVGSCMQVPSTAYSVGLDGTPTPPGCASDNVTATIPEIQWSDRRSGCSFESIGCGSDICAPAGERYCFYRPNMGPPVQCPAGFIDTHVIEPPSAVDSRDCVCNCEGFGVCSVPLWTVYGDTSCVDQLNSEQASCVDSNGGGAIMSASVTVAATGSCKAAQLVSGEVDAKPTLQLCCSPL